MWRFIDTGVGDASWNMALDEALLNTFKEDDLPILRLYRWKPALSVGRFSSIMQSVDMNRLDRQKISCVRRMTGGGILVHGGELSYSLILPHKALKDKGVKESYRYLCRFLIRFYEKLSLNANFACDLQMEEERSDICLAGNESYDIVIKGKKIGGNAQRHTRKTLFQHGSIPINIDKELFKPLFLNDSGLERAATLERLASSVKYEQLAELLRETFCKTFNVNVISDTLNLTEKQNAKKLLKQKYSTKRWNIYGKQDCT